MNRTRGMMILWALTGACGGGTDGGDEVAKKQLSQLEKRVEALEQAVGRDRGKENVDRKPAASSERKDVGQGEKKVDADGARKGKVDVQGDATKVALLRDGARFEIPGAVPAGAYQLVARFGDDKAEPIDVQVKAGEVLRVSCKADAKKCVAK